jgi:DNA-binding response OmpR family regulator
MAALKFLVVDDARFIRDMLKKNLRDYFPGAEVTDMPSAIKAKAAMKTTRFDMILCDWEMPEMTGEEFLQWVRSQEAYKHIPFIMVTSRGERDYIVKAAQAGVNDYVGKPFSPDTLISKVSKVFKKVGVKIPGNAGMAKAQALSSSSADLLTGSAPKVDTVKTNSKVSSGSASLLMGGSPAAAKPAAAPAPKKPAVKKTAKGQAQLNFPGFNTQCVIKNISLQMMSAAIKRGEQLPSILEQVVISIVQNDGEDVARLNGYVHSIQAAENHIDSSVLNLVIRFVDEDPDKLEHLSKYISNL